MHHDSFKEAEQAYFLIPNLIMISKNIEILCNLEIIKYLSYMLSQYMNKALVFYRIQLLFYLIQQTYISILVVASHIHTFNTRFPVFVAFLNNIKTKGIIHLYPKFLLCKTKTVGSILWAFLKIRRDVWCHTLNVEEQQYKFSISLLSLQIKLGILWARFWFVTPCVI